MTTNLISFLLDGVEKPYVFTALLVAKKKYSDNPDFPSRITLRSWIVRDVERFLAEDVKNLKFPIIYKGLEVPQTACALYVSLNPRDPRKATKILAEESVKLLYSNDVKAMSRLDRLVISAYAKSPLTKEKFFIDVDVVEPTQKGFILDSFKELFGDKISLVVETRGGFHLLFKRSSFTGEKLGYVFRKEFVKELPDKVKELTTEIDVKSDRYTQLPIKL